MKFILLCSLQKWPEPSLATTTLPRFEAYDIQELGLTKNVQLQQATYHFLSEP